MGAPNVGPRDEPAVGTGTATLDYAADNKTVEHSSTAADGVRGVLDEAPSAGAKTAHVWSVIRP
ncbi:hypothetical protein MTF65_00100 [Streptomyces sp. APSN-46.1]|uniref:hypothetical protein n=1 Tax=Streptomyces sp. APSN-46.1 TaxID=2929049 RepID=UPI001FB22402|nr:hypothetical protein [Streptomyces sp. APSN-46.1]MCJ1675786.1 hypothetical protein [Streptomyces sp. APSN-46.1]